jgi:hypothetical protein
LNANATIQHSSVPPPKLAAKHAVETMHGTGVCWINHWVKASANAVNLKKIDGR